jgi:hypothetical protein
MTASGYPNNLKRSRKLTMNAVGSVNLDCGVSKVPTLGRSEWGGQVNAYSSGASGPSKESGWAVAMFPDVGMGVEPGWAVVGYPEEVA